MPDLGPGKRAAPDLGPGKRTLTEQLGPGAAPSRAAAEHVESNLNAVIAVVARGADGAELARWRARGRWDGPLPVRYHGSRAPMGWTWSDKAARDTRIHTLADGTGGESIERWAMAHGAATVDVIAFGIGATPQPDTADDPDPVGRLERVFGRRTGAGVPGGDRLERVFGRRTGAGVPGGDPHGRTGLDTAIGGTGPGGPHARSGGDHEGSKTRGLTQDSRFGSALGVNGGAIDGRFGGEGKPGDNGVRMAGAIAGGVIAIPAALKGFVEILLLADAGDITGEGANLFKTFGREMAGVSAAAVREWIAGEARQFCEREVQAAAERFASDPAWIALSDDEQRRVMEIAWYEQMRRFFRGFGKAAKDAEPELKDAARVAMEAAGVEPVAGRLPANHEYAGKEFPREQLPRKYRDNGLRFKSTGYPDFEPYAITLPNGKKTVRIELTGSHRADVALANKAAGFNKTLPPPPKYTWHHLEDEGEMMLVPTDLHDDVPHTGGRAHYKHRTRIDYAP